MAIFSKDAYKSRVIFTGVAIAVVLIGFQNCGKSSLKVEPPTLEGATEQKPAMANLAGSDRVTLFKTEHSFATFKYEINLVNGLVKKTYAGLSEKDPDYIEEVLCLSDSKRQSLYDITNASSVCHYKPTRDDIACAMVYHPAYAIAYQTRIGIRQTEDQEFLLGENASACTAFFDICQETRTDFIAVTRDVLSDIDSSLCVK